MISEISRRKTNMIWYHLYVGRKKAELIGNGRMVVVRRCESGEN